MAGRPSRTSSIPIPRSNASLPSLEDMMSIPFNTASPPLPRPRAPSGSAATLAFRSPSALAGSPPTQHSRSLTSSSILHYQPAATVATGISPELPRIIRGNTTSNSWAEVACSPPPTSPTRNRRPSASATMARTPSASRPVGVSGSWQTPSATQPPLSAPIPFPRPKYLNFSALCDLLQTELPPTLPPGRYAPPSVWTNPAAKSRGRSLTATPTDDSEDDVSPPPRRRASTGPASGVALVGSTPVFRLPTRWSEQDRHTYLSVSNDGRQLTYDGLAQMSASSNIDNAGLARTNHPIPPACGIYYYEIAIVGKNQKAHVSVGFAAMEARLTRLPGHEKNSWGYHGDDGLAYGGDKNSGTTYGEPFGGGDIIGAGIDFTQNRAFFTKNGKLISYVFDRVAEDVEVYPSVGLRHTTDLVRVNFGHEDFLYQIDDHVQQQRDAIWERTQRIAVDWRVLEPGRTAAASASIAPEPSLGNEKEIELEMKGKEEMGKLVLGYLVHHGYAKTAKAFEDRLKKTVPHHREHSRMESDSPALPVPPPSFASASTSTYVFGADSDLPMVDATETAATAKSVPALSSAEALAHRLAIVQAVQKGDIDTAISETKSHFPDVLEREQGLVLLKLRCRKFVELVNEAAEMKRRVERASSLTNPETVGGAAPMDGMNGAGNGTLLDDGEVELDADDSMEVDDGGALPVPAPMSDSIPSASTRNGTTLNPLPTSPSVPQPFRAPLPPSTTSHPSATISPPPHPSLAAAEAALRAAIAYGQTLRADYKKDPRKDVQAYLDRSFGVVAYHFPMEAGGAVGKWAGQGARDALAGEVNQAILESQGWPARPALERVYRQTAASLAQLGFLGVGAAVFADVHKEMFPPESSDSSS